MQKSLDLIHVLFVATEFMTNERPELFPDDHPIVILLKALDGSPLADSLGKQVNEKNDEDVVMMLYEVLNAAWKQLETYH